MTENMLNIQHNQYQNYEDDAMSIANQAAEGPTSSPFTQQVASGKEVKDTPNNSVVQPLFKCSCSWKNCRAYQKAFRQIQHDVFDGVIKVKIMEDNPESIAYLQCLQRTLGIDQKTEWKDALATATPQQQQPNSDLDPNKEAQTNRRFCRYIIAKHHFTEQHIRKYESKNKIFSFTKPFSYHGAKKYLYKVDPRETYVAPSTSSSIIDPEEALYLQCPNVPSDVVKGTYHKIAQVIQQRKKLLSHHKVGPSGVPKRMNDDGDFDKERRQDLIKSTSRSERNNVNEQQIRTQQSQHEIEKDQKAQKPDVTTNQSTSQGSQESISNFDVASIQSKKDAMTDSPDEQEVQRNPDVQNASNIDYCVMFMKSQSENKELKQQLESLKSRFEVLQNMMEAFQTRHDLSSRHSRGSRQTFISSTSSKSRRRIKQVQTRSIDSVPGGDRSEEDDEHDSHMDHTAILSRSLDDVSEMQTLATGASFHSRFTPRNGDLYEDPESGSDDDEYSYADCMSLGTSTIISASRSVKSLPRERELDDYDGDETSDDGMTFPKGSQHRTNSVVSFESNSIQSPNATYSAKYSRSSNRSLLQRRPPTHRCTPISKGATTIQKQTRQNRRFGHNSIGSIESRLNCSVGSLGHAGDNSVMGGVTFASSPKSATNTVSISALSLIDQESAANTTLSASEMYIEDEEYSRQIRIQASKTKQIDHVINIHVTDPHGEHGIYSGQICRETGRPHGFGRLEYDKAGRWYEGDWKFGRWSGRGKISNGLGDHYEGDVANDLKHGFGFMHFADGRTYEGQYDNGEMVDGKMTYEDGSTYDGQWKNGLRHGNGRCIFVDDSIYEGDFVDGEFCGQGKMMWPDGGWYKGDWNNGEMHGIGSEVRPDGTLRHFGQWSRGRPMRPDT
jgi:hypothetical protein